MAKPKLSDDGRTITVRVPISIRRRGGGSWCSRPTAPNVTAAPVSRHIDNAMVKAIARAFRWREMLENGDVRDHRGDRRRREDQRDPTSAACCG